MAEAWATLFSTHIGLPAAGARPGGPARDGPGGNRREIRRAVARPREAARPARGGRGGGHGARGQPTLLLPRQRRRGRQDDRRAGLQLARGAGAPCQVGEWAP
eukprot:scaffold65441_cov66-Phaeocystis_antarctica.AAC.6